ncbi:MAG: thermonuclease family protein [Pseudomonadota bacterium]|nr:thermonuclease family protein [Pseudomonadota bacterium]
MPLNLNFRRLRSSRRLDLVVFGLIVLAGLAFLAVLPEREVAGAAGFARVIDGDSIVVQGTEIRLRGIDAPEAGQTCTRGGAQWDCGAQASRHLRQMLEGRYVDCSGSGYDVHHRLLARCRIGEVEVNRAMVEQGWAVSYDDYADAERLARLEHRGVWSGEFEQPHDWRVRHGRGG